MMSYRENLVIQDTGEGQVLKAAPAVVECG